MKTEQVNPDTFVDNSVDTFMGHFVGAFVGSLRRTKNQGKINPRGCCCRGFRGHSRGWTRGPTHGATRG